MRELAGGFSGFLVKDFFGFLDEGLLDFLEERHDDDDVARR